MSKKKNTKKQAANGKTKAAKPKKAPVKKSPVKGIVIGAVAVLLAAAVAVGIYFVAKNNDSGKTTYSGEIDTLPDEGTQYAMAKYKTTKFPVEIVELLAQAEKDSAEACEKYGVAIELGDRDISVPEFVMYYYDMYYNKCIEVDYAIQTTGANRTGFDPEKFPADQKHVTEDHTWEEAFIIDSIADLQNTYMSFDDAVEAGYELDVVTIAGIIDTMETIQENEKSLTEYYCEGLTKNMFIAREVMAVVASVYQNKKFAEIQNSYGPEQIEERLNENPGAYMVSKVRVYAIEGEYNEAEASAVKNEKELLAYAKRNHPNADYDAEFSTDCGFITKEKLSSVYGTEVGEWAFEKGRKSGDTALIKGQLFNYVVYVDVPAFYSTSANVMLAPTLVNASAMTAEEITETLKNAQNAYNEWKNNDRTLDGFYNYSTSAGGEGEITVRIGDYHFLIDNWIFDPERKEGDYTLIETPDGCCAVYYLGKNEDDFDWESNILAELANEEMISHYDELREDDYDAKRNKNSVAKACKEGEGCIERYLERLKEKQAEQQ